MWRALKHLVIYLLVFHVLITAIFGGIDSRLGIADEPVGTKGVVQFLFGFYTILALLFLLISRRSCTFLNLISIGAGALAGTSAYIYVMAQLFRSLMSFEASWEVVVYYILMFLSGTAGAKIGLGLTDRLKVTLRSVMRS